MSLEDDCRIAYEMAQQLGSKAAASKELGIPASTLKSRIARYEAMGKPGQAKPPPEAEQSQRVRELEKLVAQQAERIENLHASKFKIPKAPKMKSGEGVFTRIIIPDTHGCFVDEAALAAFLHDLESLAPNVKQIVWLGDHLDCGGFLAQHHTLSYVAEATYTFEDDVAAANALLDKVQEICPEAEHHFLEGNHERRIERWCLTQTLRNKADTNYLLKLFSVESVLHLEKRGFHFYKQGQFYHGLSIPATIKLDHCHFTHGSRTGKHAAAAMLSDFGGNVVFGHTHRRDSHSGRTVHDGEMGAWCPGALCRLQPLWSHTQVTRWTHGYGMQTVEPGVGFFHANVPIINGRSYLPRERT